MRESRAPVPRPPRVLQPRYTPRIENFDLVDIVITVDGEDIRLGDWWPIARAAAEGSLRGK